MSTNDVTFDDMYQYLSSYRFSDYYYNGSIASYYFFCTHIEGESARHLASGLGDGLLIDPPIEQL